MGHMSDTTIITLRLPQSLVDRADALIADLAEDEESLLLGRVSRSIVIRLSVLRGLDARGPSRRQGRNAGCWQETRTRALGPLGLLLIPVPRPPRQVRTDLA